MKEFFNGWRRKLGCVTLVMAFVFVGGWLRSLRIFDRINCPLGRECAIAVTSWEGVFASRIGWDNDDPWDVFDWRVRDQDYYGYTDPNDENGCYRLTQPIPDGSGCFVSWYLLGENSGIGVTPLDQRSYRRMLFMIVPYSFIVVPLTLLSAFLLLSKPRKSTQKRITEPNANEGA